MTAKARPSDHLYWRDARRLPTLIRSGWTVGAGIEYALGYGWSIKGEYLYVRFDDWTTFTTPPFGFGNISPINVKLQDNVFRAGMNYKFGWY